MGDMTHRMFDIDPETRLGRCATCGPDIKSIKGQCSVRVNSRKTERRKAKPPKSQSRTYDRRLVTYKGTLGKFTIRVDERRELVSKSQCAICKSTKNLVIDHCHVKGVMRDVLCSNCNVMLGMAKDDISILARAIEYLSEHQ